YTFRNAHDERPPSARALLACPRFRALPGRARRTLGLLRERRVRVHAVEPLPCVDSRRGRRRRLRRPAPGGAPDAPAAPRWDLAVLPPEPADPPPPLPPPRLQRRRAALVRHRPLRLVRLDGDAARVPLDLPDAGGRPPRVGLGLGVGPRARPP